MLFQRACTCFMSTVTFDTHKFIRKLRESGMPDAQAEAVVDALR